jgi:hypothetical protein
MTLVEARLVILSERALELAARVETGQLPFIDSVDLAYSAAMWSGLVDTAGDDIVQAVLADAFMRTKGGRATEEVSI